MDARVVLDSGHVILVAPNDIILVQKTYTTGLLSERRRAGHCDPAFHEIITCVNFNMSCPFKDILGKPREGSHSIRIPLLDISLVDTVLTFIGAYFIQKQFPKYSYLQVLIAFFVLGELLHILFCVKTQIAKHFM